MVAPPIPFRGRSREYGAYATQTSLWRADRFGNKIERLNIGDVVSGSIQHSDDRDQPRTMSITVNDPRALEDFHDWVIPEIRLTRPNGVTRVGQFGLFMATPAKTTYGISGRLEGSIEAVDATFLLSRAAMTPQTFAIGRDTGEICREIALGAGFLSSQIDIPNTGYQLVEVGKVDPGESRLDVMNRLLALSLWRPVWMSNSCRLRSRREVPLHEEPPRTMYSTRRDIVEILPGISGETNWADLCNHVIVRRMGNGDDEPTLYGNAWVTNTNHPLYYNRLDPASGRFPIELAPDPIDVQDIETQAQIDELARIELSKRASRRHNVRMTTVVDLDADAYDVVELDVWNGTRPIHTGKWRRDGWTITIDGLVTTIDSQLYRVEEIG